jgi:hypothetical protein
MNILCKLLEDEKLQEVSLKIKKKKKPKVRGLHGNHKGGDWRGVKTPEGKGKHLNNLKPSVSVYRTAPKV